MHPHEASATLGGSPLVWVGLGLLMAVIGVPLLLRKIKPNGLYGFRTARTLADPRIWFEVNAVLGRDLIVLGAALVATTLVFWVAGAADHGVLLGLFLIGLAASTLHGWLVLRRL